jgi:hypothetical protein
MATLYLPLGTDGMVKLPVCIVTALKVLLLSRFLTSTLPGLNGFELVRKLLQYRPELRVLLMSGYTGE